MKFLQPAIISIVLPLFIFACNYGIAQPEVENPIIYGVKAHYGFIWAHSDELADISQSNPVGFQLEWSKINLSQRAWEKCNCYSKTGFAFSYFNYRNPEVLGSSYNLYAFAEPFLNLDAPWNYTLRGGIGVSYLDKVYDEEKNPENLFFSSPLSFIVLINAAVNYRITPQWAVSITAHYNHISNGGMKKPNKGMNFPTISMGTAYTPKGYKLIKREKVHGEKGQINGYTRLFTTRPDVPATDELPAGRAWLFGISGGLIMQITNLNALNFGVELVKDYSLKEEGERKDIDEDHHFIAIAAGHHLTFGRFDFNQQMAYYLYKPFPFTNNKFYQRYEIAYHINDYLLAGISLKTHGHVAENFDVRIGFTF